MPSLSGHNTAPLVSTSTGQHKDSTKASHKANIINMSKDQAKEVTNDLSKAVSSMLETSDRCEQDTMEGVEEKDWEE